MVHSHQFTNLKNQFFEGIFVSCKSPFVQFRICGTFENNKQRMLGISFNRFPMKTIISNAEINGIFLKFNKPINVFYLKIDFIGEDISFYDFYPKMIIEKSYEESLAFVKTKKVGFLGVARNCENSVLNSITSIAKVGNLFNSYKIFLLENDSIDGTRSVIKSFANLPYFKPVFLDGLENQFTTRTSRLAFCRNALLNLSNRNEFDYIVCFDADGVFKDINIESVIKVFQYEECWDAVFPVMNPYYDLWALRHPSLLNDDYEKIISRLPASMGQTNATRLITDSIRSLDFTQFEGWLSVDSAFGGLGIYRSSVYYQSSYWGEQGGSEICEHVPFHKRLKELGANLYIVPDFKIS